MILSRFPQECRQAIVVDGAEGIKNQNRLLNYH